MEIQVLIIKSVIIVSTVLDSISVQIAGSLQF